MWIEHEIYKLCLKYGMTVETANKGNHLLIVRNGVRILEVWPSTETVKNRRNGKTVKGGGIEQLKDWLENHLPTKPL